jgi:hypothetical protein
MTAMHHLFAPLEKRLLKLLADVKIVKWYLGIMVSILLTLMIPVVHGLYQQCVLGEG